MSLRLGTTLISGVATNTVKNSAQLLEARWFDHTLNSQEWLRADTFSWQSGTVYTAAYNHLVADLVDATASVETVGSYSITVYTATDGHKIVLDDMESTVINIFNESGVAWYYIIDTTNTRFKLPRTKYGFTGLRDEVGKFVPESLPNIKGGGYKATQWGGSSTFTGAFSDSTSVYQGGIAGTGPSSYLETLDFNASNSSSTYKDNSPVQQRATQMYLYFYVGQFSQSATEQTAGLNSEMFNQKVDVSSLTECHTVVETYQNGTEWYRLYSDGWVEQGGMCNISQDSATTVNLLKSMSDTAYTILITARKDGSTQTGGDGNFTADPISTSQFYWRNGDDFTGYGYWEVKGYAAQ